LQLTAFGARDRAFFEISLRRAPWRQLKRNTLGHRHQRPAHTLSVFCYTPAIIVPIS